MYLLSSLIWRTAMQDLVVLTLPEIGEDNVYGPMCLAYITSVCVMDEDLIQVFKYLRYSFILSGDVSCISYSYNTG